MFNPRTGFASIVLCASVMTPALAGPDWEEINDGGADAGRLPGSAQETIGAGAISSISGTISATDHEDVYAIKISSAGSFSAVVALNSAVAGAANSRLWLFDDAGKGILGNDNSSSVSVDPAMGSIATDSSRAKVRTTGRYYIAVSVSGSSPINPSGGIFKLASVTEVSGPDDAGGKFTVTDWTPATGSIGTFSYTITFTGAGFASPPPAAVAGGPPACVVPPPGAGNCLVPTPGVPGCTNHACCTEVCSIDPICCFAFWDQQCAQIAQMTCGIALAPANDHCSNPTPINVGLTPFDTTGATTEGPPHPSCGTPQIFSDIWFTHIARCTGDLTVSTCGATTGGFPPGPAVFFDSQIAIYSVVSCSPAVLISSLMACNDDAPGCPLFASSVRVPVIAGHTYLIRLGSFQDGPLETGAGVLLLECVPGGGSPGCGEPGAGDCFIPHLTQGCIDDTCCETISALDRFCCDNRWDQFCAHKAVMLCSEKAGFEPGLIINEIRIDQPGADNDEYFELKGQPGLPLFDVSYIVIGDPPLLAGSGVIEAVVDLSGTVIPSDRHLLVAEDGSTFGAIPDLIANLNFENLDNVTHLLVLNFHGFDGQDLDTNDDGVLDIQPWGAVIDRIAVIRSPNPPVGTEFHYGPPTIGPDGPGVAPGHVYRCERSSVWTIGQFDPLGGQDTPGVTNVSCLQPIGACCLPSGLCVAVTAASCTAQIGTYHGDSTICALVSCPQPCPGGACPSDLNGDGFVNSLDLGILLSNWSIPASAPGCGGLLPCCADLNHDGKVNSLDLGILLAAWSIPPGAPGCS